MKVLYLSIADIDEESRKIIEEGLNPGIEMVFILYDKRDDAVKRAAEFDVVIGARIPRAFWEKAENCCYFIIPFAGIPPQDAKILPDFPHIKIINSHFNAPYVAEHAWALLLASVKKICPIHEQMKRGNWMPRYEHQFGQSVRGKTLLLIGYGAIGKFLAEIGKAFGMTVKAVKRTPGKAPHLDFLGTLRDLSTLLPNADFIIVSLPGTEATRGFLGRKEFGLMKDGVHIVNIGRGYVIDEDAFYEALKSGKIGGAGIDTWWKYPPDVEARSNTQPSKYPLHEFDNIIFSPHRASHIAGREQARMKDLSDILNSIAQGNPVNTVDLESGY